MKVIKNTEKVVLTVLERNKRAREDDFILYGGVLKEMGINLQTSLYEFLANAKTNKVPTFETVTRCRRHIQELKQELRKGKIAVKRQDREEDFKRYNLSSLGE